MGHKVDKWGDVGHSGDTGQEVFTKGQENEDGRKRAEVFLGEYFHSLDGKGRVVMPAAFRHALEDGCVLTKGQDSQLIVYSKVDFEARALEVTERPQDRSGRRFSRTMFGGADLQIPDKSGRLLVKPDLRQFAGLDLSTEIAVVGLFDHVELWSTDAYLADRSAGDEIYREEDEA